MLLSCLDSMHVLDLNLHFLPGYLQGYLLGNVLCIWPGVFAGNVLGIWPGVCAGHMAW